MSTGVPYIEIILSDTTGFDILPLARPQEITAPKALLKDVTLFRIFGMFLCVDLMTPTCSA